MLLDFIADDSMPHQHHIDDGLAFQLELLEALKKAQKDAVIHDAATRASATSASSSEALSKYAPLPIKVRLIKL